MAKRTRRERRIGAGRRTGSSQLFEEAAEEIVEAETPVVSAPPVASPTNGRSQVNFAQEYFYVFSEVRGLLIITAILFAVMIGLTFVV
jgi:hypothetical protein